jgi:sugar phosphate isomerase/epimerase
MLNSTRLVALALVLICCAHPTVADTSIFAHDNLVAWCIVPYDAAKRSPEDRAAMLERLGIHKFAYDWRAEHLPHFEEEVAALDRHHIELTAVWFPTTLNNDGKFILAALAKHQLRPQIWVMGGGNPTTSPAEQAKRVETECNRIRPIAEEAAKIGCTVALYNHGGWFGEPENQLAIIEKLKLANVGIVYNLHHGHAHVGRLAALLELMKPHLMALNVNGMDPDGDKKGRMILPIGQGELDLQLLKTIADSGWRGPVGILNHTIESDAEARLRDNLAGLDWLVAQLDGKPAGAKPLPSSWPIKQPG